MGKTVRILGRSVYTFLQKYQSYTTTAAILALSYAALVLLSESAIPSSALLQGIHNRLQSLFDAAGFPRSSDFFAILNIKLSQTIAESYLIFPFIFTFFLFTKAFLIHAFSNHKAVS
ncbi:OLC1v1012013C1 [Oldenlandia corymbosa var. corymbosa]|uniref:OLC1v1012013C1 n=1 Tax=Oldenlandia corymbosa var. corymbosa TaxID=529605 RepID=A0AAV1DWT5_OLDCO|nr:OLC1v1012013C1 [Oldenlandia corymbosa var. corymbosa]